MGRRVPWKKMIRGREWEREKRVDRGRRWSEKKKIRLNTWR